LVKYTVEITEEEDKVLRAWLDDPQKWLEHALRNKLRKRLDGAIVVLTDKNPKKMTHEEKLAELKGKDLNSVKSQNALQNNKLKV